MEQTDLGDLIVRGDVKAVEKLLDGGLSPDAYFNNDYALLHQAAEHGKAAVVRLLLGRGAKPDLATKMWRYTPLMLAAQGGHKDVVRMLLDAGADVRRESDGYTALHKAAGQSRPAQPDIIRTLTAAGADVHATRGGKSTPLMDAAMHGGVANIEPLIAAGADVNSLQEFGTALSIAVFGSRPTIVKALLEHGAEVDRPVPWLANKTVLQYARQEGLKRILSLLNRAARGRQPAPKAKPKLKAKPKVKPKRPRFSAAQVPALWQRLETWLAEHAPDVKATLRKGATDKQLANLEKRLSLGLPDDFKAAYRLHDGQTDDGPTLLPPPDEWDAGYQLLPVQGILDEWKPWKELVEGGEFEGRQGVPDAGVRRDWWNVGWVPFASNGGGDSYCLDLAPASRGKVGQVIHVSHESAERKRLAGSFAEWLAGLAEALERGEGQE